MKITNKIKKIITLVLVGVLMLLGTTCLIQCKTNQRLKQEYAVATANEKALMGRIEGNQKDIVAYQTTISTLRHTNDSIIQHLMDKQKELKIKDKELQAMASLESNFHTVDTIRLTDTIFRDPSFALDTCIKDEWRSIDLHMHYPGDICVDSKMRSQKEVYVTTVRETIEPPKKCWFLRLFQKKHTVARVKIEEDNPYLESERNVYIQVIN